ncbi:ubiquitin carboxyl-terminal hydrolase CYLD-like [Diretmus argenteus]
MSGALELTRRRRPPKMFLILTELRVQDHLEGTIRLQRGNMCQEQDAGRSRGDQLWVKVLDNGIMVKLEKKFLVEVPTDSSGLLEPVSDPESRLKLLSNPGNLQRLAALPLGTPLWVQMGQPDELAEAELRYRGPLTRGSSAVFFGVQLKGSAAGRGVSNGSYKGHQLFTCPEASALFVPANHVRLRRWSRGNDSDEHDRARERERDHHHGSSNGNHPGNSHHSNNHHQNPQQQHNVRSSFHQHQPISPPQLPPIAVLSRTAESVPFTAQAPVQVRGPASPPPFQVGQRVCFPLEDTVHGGEVGYCGPLPGRASPAIYVGVLLDAPVGNWDGSYKGEKLCHIPSPLYGHLLPIAKVSSEPKSRRHNPLLQNPKPILKPVQVTVSKPGPAPSPTSAPKIALMPPQLISAKQVLKPPPQPPPKPTDKPLPPPPLPPPKPQGPPSPTAADQPLQPSNGAHGPPSPLRSPGNGEDARENGETGLDVELEVGSMVEVNDPPLFGVIRWIGRISGIPEPVAGIELDQELTAGTDGSYLGERHFRCPANKGLFVKLRNCRRDSRFPAPETPVNQVERCNSIAFAEWGSERVEEDTPPVEGEEARELYQGWKRGIQGHLNSCYLDASLFSLFSCCSSADWVLLWPTDPQTGLHSSQAQDLLRCEIVNPLRRFGYVCASKTMDELGCRVEFLLEHCFQSEREEMETMENVNKLLLQNVLPLHVACFFMGKTIRNQDLYSTSCDCVCVMFASVPQFKEFYSESSANRDGLECLRFLNEIISDFDELLSKPKFSSVEKIKTIGSTYMAAAGLNKTASGEERKETEMSYSHVRCMLEFAIALMGKLELINTHSFNSFKLRIGINHGPVIAAVIGALKPQYDIWGNSVNVASRMDSTGVLDKIQVTEETAQVVQSLGYSVTLRGVVNVKGKGELTTYFINTD